MAFRGVLAATVLVVGLLSVGCGGGGGSAAGTAPTSTAVTSSSTPAEVVGAFLDRLAAGDPHAAAGLCTSRFAAETRRASDGWFGQRVAFGDVVLGAEQSGEGTAPAQRFAQVVIVPASFDLTQDHPASLPNGPTTWGFTLARNGDGDAWRIDGMGSG